MEIIDKNNIQNIHLGESPIILDKYDMYYVKLKLKDGTERIIRVFCDKGTFPKLDSEDYKRLMHSSSGQSICYGFFVNSLICSNNLRNIQSREDYIYLGSFDKDKRTSSRLIKQSNGKTGQQNFDDNLKNIKMHVEEQESVLNIRNKLNKCKKGKTYVMSDIHGMYGSYLDAMNKLSINDHVIILGDVIDRGENGIQILRDIMQRKKEKDRNPKITFVLGNHELMLNNTSLIANKKKLNSDDFCTIIKNDILYSKLNNYKNSGKEYELCQKEYYENNQKLKKLIFEKGLNKETINYIIKWVMDNGGLKTLNDFFMLNQNEQDKIFCFLCESYVALPQRINNKDYLFVHAMPPKDIQKIKKMKETGKGYTFLDLYEDPKEYLFMLQERTISTYNNAKNVGFVTVCGHTPSIGNITRNDKEGYIRIDAGCGKGSSKSKLALYCIDDDTVVYIDEKKSLQQEPTL